MDSTDKAKLAALNKTLERLEQVSVCSLVSLPPSHCLTPSFHIADHP